ncbi:tRNA (adenosine(37)-N6)-threonylcarbamoyltransferase complex transferase subunit TsaD, partial [Shouchella clausii]
TEGPGLVGALLTGINAAKAVAFSHGIPLIGVHHIAGHIYANRLIKELEFPLLALVVSGGHTELVYMKEHANFEVIGETLDDAAGEAYDKVARTLGLPYPGGPHI